MKNLPEIKRLSDGAINNKYYQDKARDIRSGAAYSGMSLIVKLFANKSNASKQAWMASHRCK